MNACFKTAAAGVVAGMLTLSAFAASAQTASESGIPGEFSANVAFTSEYFFRGISQTDDAPAIQGGFDYSLGVGSGTSVYLGAWGSNVDFNEDAADDGATVEMDVYGGLNGTFGDTGLGWDAGFIYYAYPGAASDLDYDFWEVQAALSYDIGPASTTASVNYSPEFFGDTGEAFYYKLGLDVPVGGTPLTLSGHVGYQTIDEGDDYTDWSVGGTLALAGFDFNLAWTDTDLDGCEDLCGMVIFTVSRAF